jgi:hypothetical protein
MAKVGRTGSTIVVVAGLRGRTRANHTLSNFVRLARGRIQILVRWPD